MAKYVVMQDVSLPTSTVRAGDTIDSTVQAQLYNALLTTGVQLVATPNPTVEAWATSARVLRQRGALPAPPPVTDLAGPPISADPSTSIEAYGGGIGSTAAVNAAAIDAAIAALASVGGGVLIAGAGTYATTGNHTVMANTRIEGRGQGVTAFTTTSNAPVFVVGGENVSFSNFSIIGNISAYAPSSLQYGIKNVAHSKVFLDRIVMESLAVGYYSDTPGPEVYLGANLLQCVTKTCSTGFLFSTNEYHTAVGCIARGCYDVGFDIASGNIALIGGAATSCNVGVKIRASANDAHGICSGLQINHNSQAIYIDTIANGFTFDACHVYYGNIYVISSTGVQFIGGEYDVLAYYFDGSTGTTFENIRFPMVNTNTINDSYNSHPSTEEWTHCRKLDGAPFIGGYASMTPVNGAQTLTYAQSHADELELLAGATGAVTLTSRRMPKSSVKQTVRNNTSQTVTYGWSTGTTVSLATATSAIISADGTNARKMLAGT